MEDYKPTSFCWACGRKLWNKNKPTVRIIDGHPRTLHKFCAKDVDFMSGQGVTGSQHDSFNTLDEQMEEE